MSFGPAKSRLSVRLLQNISRVISGAPVAAADKGRRAPLPPPAWQTGVAWLGGLFCLLPFLLMPFLYVILSAHMCRI